MLTAVAVGGYTSFEEERKCSGGKDLLFALVADVADMLVGAHSICDGESQGEASQQAMYDALIDRLMDQWGRDVFVRGIINRDK